MSSDLRDKKQGTIPEQLAPDTQVEQDRVLDSDSIELGLLAIGADEAAHRLGEMQWKLDEDPSLWESERPSGAKSLRRQAWYLGVGLIQRSQRRLRSDLRRGFERFLGTADRASYDSTQWAGSRLPRPVHDAFATRLVQWREDALELVKEGALEEQKGRALASGAVSELISEIMEDVSKNPEIQDAVQDLVGQQGVGMATSAVDNARSVTVTADDAVEGLIRWLFRRTPRR